MGTLSNVVDEAIDALREAIVAQEKINQSLRGVIARLGPRQSPPVCPYCWGDRQDGLTDAEWGDQVARCREYKPSYDAIRRTLWAIGSPDAAWLAEVAECQANKEKG